MSSPKMAVNQFSRAQASANYLYFVLSTHPREITGLHLSLGKQVFLK